eukprot:COSAG05_NODE_6834_length_894_cov_1.275472_1_plen_227_part_01
MATATANPMAENRTADNVTVPESLLAGTTEKLAEWKLSLAENEDGDVKENEFDRQKRLAQEILAQSHLISPDSSFRKRWDILQIFLLVYVAVGVPYRLGFMVEVVLWQFWFWFDLFVDIYFISDVFVSLRTAYYDGRGMLVVSPAAIRRHYMFAPPYWFFVDVLACFPGNYIEWVAQAKGWVETDEASSSGRANKLLRMLRLLRLLKLLRLARINRLVARYEEELYE